MFMKSLYFNKKEIEKLETIGKGCEGKVVKLNEDTAIKLYNASKFNLHDFKFTNLNFRYIVLPKSKVYINTKFAGYTMNYINGKNLNNINLSKVSYKDLILYCNLIKEEIKILSDMLIPFKDLSLNNIIYNNGFYIVDSFYNKNLNLTKEECFKYNNKEFNKLIFYKLLKDNIDLYNYILNNEYLKKLYMYSTPFDNLPLFLNEIEKTMKKYEMHPLE